MKHRWCLRARILVPVLIVGLFLVAGAARSTAQGTLPIGVIQGSVPESPYRGQWVTFRGVVTGVHEDQNTRGIIYYTVFVQQLPDESDQDAATADGIAVFFGRNRPQLAPGAIVTIGGEVTEFYGFTEVDDDNLRLTIERMDGELPEPVAIDPPADLVEQAAYFEPFEAMRVKLDGPARVVGPTHEGCGFAVVAATDPDEPVIRRQLADPTGRVVPVLYPTDVDCTNMPQVKTGDLVTGLVGVLVYNFDEFKILLTDPDAVSVEPADLRPVMQVPMPAPDEVSAVTLNANDWFDGQVEPDAPEEPAPLPEALAAKETKLAHVLTQLLHCPVLAGIQEVETGALLEQLAAAVSSDCGFTYAVTHLDSADPRGIDNALLTNPRRVTVHGVALRQVCSPVPTDHQDASIVCDDGDYVLFDRPPLQADLSIDGRAYTVFVNHFKSKREGEAETALERLAQARYQNALAAGLLAADPGARIIVLGDLNDYEASAPLLTLTDPARGGALTSALAAVPDSERYSYIFSGVGGLLDTILVSPALGGLVTEAGVLHINADYPVAWADEISPPLLPYRFSDHDIPWMNWRHEPPPVPTAPAPTATATRPSPVLAAVVPSPVPTAAASPTPPTVLRDATPPPAPTTSATPAQAPRPLWPWLAGFAVAIIVGVVALRRLRR